MAREYAGFLPVRSETGGPPPIKNYPLVSGTYYEGSILRLSATTGSATKFADGGTSVLGVCAAYVSTADSTTGKYPVYLPVPTTEFEAKMLGSFAPQAKVGDKVPILVGTTFNYRLRGTVAGTASLEVCAISGFHPDESLSAHTGNKFRVKFSRSIFAQTKSRVDD
ncbi:MAG: hypothetical protein WC455_11895 [Dehalococcoidia bacterium]|jgi:hypothetical protein